MAKDVHQMPTDTGDDRAKHQEERQDDDKKDGNPVHLHSCSKMDTKTMILKLCCFTSVPLRMEDDVCQDV